MKKRVYDICNQILLDGGKLSVGQVILRSRFTSGYMLMQNDFKAIQKHIDNYQRDIAELNSKP